MKAILKKDIKEEGRYNFEKGDTFKVLHKRISMTEVEDWIGFTYWLKTELFDFED
jgi:hypothetical protein